MTARQNAEDAAHVYAHNRPRLLDLFRGEGGAAEGYERAGWDVTGVDLKSLGHRGPGLFHQGDALEFLLRYGHRFDAIHASPPCQAYVASRFFNASLGRVKDHPRLIEPCREALLGTGLPYVIENVPQAPLLTPLTLCGSMFNLRVRRHRRFESGHLLTAPGLCAHRGQDFVGIYGSSAGGRGWNDDGLTDGYARKPRARSLDDARAAMGVEWAADWHGVKEAIPPAYTEHIGSQLLDHLGRAAA